MPSFDVVSEVDLNEVRNATNQVRKELQNRFDFRGTVWDMTEDKNTLVLTAESDFKLRAILDILLDKLTKRGVSLKNVDRGRLEISSAGRGRQVITFKQGLDGDVARTIAGSIRKSGLKVQSQVEGGKVRVSGKKRDDLQAAIAHLRGQEFPVALEFNNFRE